MLKLIHDQLISRLDHTVRFNGTPTIKQENVSTHLYWVTLYANLIVKDLFLNTFSEENQMEMYYEIYNTTIRLAMFSDMDEIYTGDVLYTCKYHPAIGTKIKDLLKEIVDEELEKAEEDNFIKEFKEIYRFPNKIYLSHRIFVRIVKLADWLSAYHFCFQESQLGNRQILKILEICTINIRRVIDSLLFVLQESKLSFNKSALEIL